MRVPACEPWFDRSFSTFDELTDDVPPIPLPELLEALAAKLCEDEPTTHKLCAPWPTEER